MLPFDMKKEITKNAEENKRKQKKLKLRAKQQALANQILSAQAPQPTQATFNNGGSQNA